MGIQFGRWNFDGKPVDRGYLEKIEPILASYGPDDGGSFEGDISIHYRAFHSTRESRRERQPHILRSGAIMTWDGRLDNRAELIRKLRDVVPVDATDVYLVGMAYEESGTGSFAMLTGDWALSIWNPRTRALTLAKDPIGTRHLYYSFDKDHVAWCTILDPLVLFAEETFALNEEYVAGWFSFFPATHLTPYVGIHAVPSSSLVMLSPNKHTVKKYWDFDPGREVRYKTDGEYEEHFRTVFADAVRHRLRSDSPVLAELSGGIDSSSIVCMADAIIAKGTADCSRLDTVSYFNNSEPNWNEYPYFTKVEAKRGRAGCHIDVSSQELLKFSLVSDFAATPPSGAPSTSVSRQLSECLISNKNRIVLSGIGGDEVAGGVPTALPELEDLLARGQFRALAHQLKVWSLNIRKPWFHLFFEAAREFLPSSLVGVPEFRRPAAWLNPDFVKHNRTTLDGYESRLKLIGPLPSFQHNLGTLDALRRQLACSVLPSDPPYDKRYPFLDRAFLEFMFAIPRNQLVRPGQRRSLIRRALVGIVPDEILSRKRKAYLQRSSMTAISAEMASLVEITHRMVSGSLKFVEPEAFCKVLQRVRYGQEIPIIAVMRTLGLENWLRRLQRWRQTNYPLQQEEPIVVRLG
jgi:asparagine synthase (glutamine-hydrolysing)